MCAGQGSWVMDSMAARPGEETTPVSRIRPACILCMLGDMDGHGGRLDIDFGIVMHRIGHGSSSVG